MRNEDIIGKWKVIEATSMGEDGFECVSEADLEALIANTPSDDEDGQDKIDTLKESFKTMMDFKEDGRVLTVMPVPLEELAEAEESGMVVDGMLVMEESEWKLEDDKLMYNTYGQGEIMGEELSPWAEIEMTDGVIDFMGMFKFMKI